jgi:hypothetical protein
MIPHCMQTPERTLKSNAINAIETIVAGIDNQCRVVTFVSRSNNSRYIYICTHPPRFPSRRPCGGDGIKRCNAGNAFPGGMAKFLLPQHCIGTRYMSTSSYRTHRTPQYTAILLQASVDADSLLTEHAASRDSVIANKVKRSSA